MPNQVLDQINGDATQQTPVQNQIPAGNMPAGNSMEGAVGQQLQNQVPPAGAENKQPPQEKPANETMEKVAESAGLSMDTLSAAWHEKGELPVDAYEKFEQMGLPRQVIDQVCNNVVTAEQQQVTSFKNDVAESVGGMDKLNHLVEFMKSPGFDQSRKADLEKMITLDNPTQSKLAMQEVQKMYEAANGTSGNLITGMKGGSGGGDVFASRQEQSAAYVKAERSHDPALKKATMEKVARTSRYNRANKINFQ